MNSVSSVVQSASSASSADYSYLPNSDLISGYTMGDLSVTRSYESHRNLLTSIENRFDINTISKYSYTNDAGGRRVSVIQTGAAFEPVGAMFNLYRYNSRSELTSAERYFGSSTNDTSSPVSLQDWSYAFDNIGNRTGTMKANASADYTANSLNQYTERTVHGSSDIIGSAEQDVTIEVNGNEADRQGYYWSHRLTVDNLFNPIYTQVVVEAICDPGTNAPRVVSSETGNVFVAASPEEFAYDDDGNLLSDGRFEYQWDCENRLIAATTKGGLPEDMPIVHVAFQYDYMSRRVGKTVYQSPPSLKVETTARSPLRSENAANTNWTQSDARTFVYDSWNLVRELHAQDSEIITNHYVWGIDLSGSLSGAGGIGGMLASCSSSMSHPVLFCYDGNGNVSELLSTSGAIAAHYEYSPFGETIVATGELAAENPFRFSTKYFDDETGLAYYGYRCYSPGLGRWLNRDPITELGHLWSRDAVVKSLLRSPADFEIFTRRNERPLYLFVGNDPILLIDALGLKVTNKTKSPIIVKNENPGQREIIKPGETSKESDGAVMNNTIIKHNNGVDIVITEDDSGNISWCYVTEDDKKKDHNSNIAKKIYNACVSKEKEKKLSGTYNRKNFQKDHLDWVPRKSIIDEYEDLIKDKGK